MYGIDTSLVLAGMQRARVASFACGMGDASAIMQKLVQKRATETGGPAIGEPASRETLAADLARVAAGDTAAFVRVYRATSRKVYGIVVRILGRGDLADEILQEVYLKVWQRAAEFDPARASPITWLATIARNRALDEGRRRQMGSLDDVPSLLELPSGEDIAAEHAERDQLAHLRAFMQSLEPERRRVLELVYFDGLSREAVAERLGQSPAAISRWIRSDLAKLKGMLAP